MASSSAPRSGGSRAGRSSGRGHRGKPRILRTVDETSAGGLVIDPDHRCAAIIGRIDRKGKLLWSLPKGHIEPGETEQQTAVREVAEETGVQSEVLRRLGSIDYWFIAGQHRVHKTVHHFLLEWRSGELSDADIEVSEVAWVPITELLTRLAYPDERKLVRVACELLGIDTHRDERPTAESN